MSAIREVLRLKVRKVRRVRFALSRALATGAAIALTLAVATGPASASAAGARSSFAAQARSHGLSSAQIGVLQREVNTYIAKYGGKQIAINEVAFTGGNTVFAVPGQKYAYPVTAARAGVNTGPGEICPYEYFCTFALANFEGSESEFYRCNDTLKNNNNGSWKNDQTPGVKATLYIYNTTVHKYGTVITAPAYSNDAHWTSGVVMYEVDPC
jgi:hypothetical protein